ncbi:NAD(P)H-hydrate epimerase [Herbiconiux sp. A18JL235]|uniref:NAD(P)H-hydrate epimerase n=1 Tax=Herbiconiux sp. A18JL235 TaxID=3152363 RepID=A0AB39BCN0_9MICO
MRIGYTAQQVRDAEASHLAAGEPLMERASHGLAVRIRELIEARERTLGTLAAPGGRVLLLVGSGDNGGDALFAGAELAAGGSEVLAVLTGDHAHEQGLAAARDAGVHVMAHDPGMVAESVAILWNGSTVRDHDEVPDVIVDGIVGTGASAGLRGRAHEIVEAPDVIVDGIVGTGASAGLRGRAHEIVEALLPQVLPGGGPQETGAGRELAGAGVLEPAVTSALLSVAPAERVPAVVAVDLPSGIDPDTGETADDVVLPASLTITFGGVKAGLLRGRGAELAGEIVLVPIGIEDDLAALSPAIVLA